MAPVTVGNHETIAVKNGKIIKIGRDINLSAINALVVDAEPVGQSTFIGRGAGEGPTAAS